MNSLFFFKRKYSVYYGTRDKTLSRIRVFTIKLPYVLRKRDS